MKPQMLRLKIIMDPTFYFFFFTFPLESQETLTVKKSFREKFISQKALG